MPPRGKKRTMGQPSGRLQAPPQPATPSRRQMTEESRLRLVRPGGTSLAPGSPIVEIDQTKLMNAIKEYARNPNLANSRAGLEGMVDNLLALVRYNKDSTDEAASVLTELLGMAFELVKEDFSSEKELYETSVWQSPRLIGSMQAFMAIYLSAMPYQTYELSELLLHLVDFSKSLLEQFKTMDLFHLESHVISLATLYLRVYHAYNRRSDVLGDFARETVFELFYRYNDDYIWQNNPINFLKGLSSSYNLIWTTLPEFGNVFDSISTTSTKDHLKGLYADSIALGRAALTDNRLVDGSNLNLEFMYSLIEDPSKDAKKVDRSLDIMCQVITCNNHHYTVLFPPKEVIEVNILPLLYHEEVYVKVRACHLIAVWVKSFIYRYPYGPDKDDILSSILHRLFSVAQDESNLAVEFSIARAIISLLSGPTNRECWLRPFILGGAIKKLIEAYSKLPFEVSPLLAVNLILKEFTGLVKNTRLEVFFCLCDLLKKTCKKISFCHKYGYDQAVSSQDEIKSLINTLKGLEVILIGMKESNASITRALEQKCEEELIDSLKFIYQEFLYRSPEVTGAALLTHAALHGITCSRKSSTATKRYVTILLNRILEFQNGELKSNSLEAAQSILAAFSQFP